MHLSCEGIEFVNEKIGTSVCFLEIFVYESDPPENCQFECQKIAKNCHFFQQNCQWQFSGGSGSNIEL